MGSNVLEFFKKHMNASRKAAFCSAVIVGLFVHLFKFTNTLPNLDSLQNFYSAQDVLASGRWFLSIACAPSSFFDLPWVTGLLSLLWIGLATVLVVELFRMDNVVLIVLTGALMATFPAVTEIFFYQYTADGYMLAMLLATLAVYLARMETRSLPQWIAAIVCIALCCGIYQTYVCFALMLSICYFLYILLSDTYDTRTILRRIVAHGCMYAAGLSLYFLIWKFSLFVRHVSPTTYQGIDRLGQLPLAAVPRTIVRVILETGFYFLGFLPGRDSVSVWTVLHLLFLCAFAGIVLYALAHTKLARKKGRFVLFLACGAAIPFAAFFWMFATSSIEYMGFRMKHSFIALFILAAVLFEKYARLRWKNVMALLLLCMILTNAVTANIHYFYMQRMWDKSYAAATEMVTRLHEADDGKAKYLVVVGREAHATDPNYIDKATLGYYYYFQLNTLLRDEYNTALFLGNVMEYSLRYYMIHPGAKPNFEVSETSRRGHMNSKISLMEPEQRNALIRSDEVRAMKYWPAAGSVKQIGDALVVKYSDETVRT